MYCKFYVYFFVNVYSRTVLETRPMHATLLDYCYNNYYCSATKPLILTKTAWNAQGCMNGMQ